MADDLFGVLRPPVPGQQKTIVVLGAPRGGTSMVAATLRALGVMMGEELGSQHEDREFRRDVPLPEMIRTIHERNAAYDLWGWKLPNSIYYLEELLPHLRNPHFIVVFRNPFSISMSSAARDRREYTLRLLHVAVNHTKKVLNLMEQVHVPTALVGFETAIKKPQDFVRALADFIGVNCDDRAVEEVIDAAISKELGYRRL